MDSPKASGSASAGRAAETAGAPTAVTLRAEMRETVRDLLLEIPGFRALAEHGIPAELIPRLPRAPVGEPGRPEKAALAGLPAVPTPTDGSPDVGASKQAGRSGSRRLG